MSDINFSIVIPTTGRKYFLNRLLKTITTQEGVSYEVIVVHDSDQYTQLWSGSAFSKFPVEYHHSGGKKGANYCRNYGLEKATGDIVYFLDDDVYLPDGVFLYRILEMFKNFDDPFICGGYYKTPMGTTLPQFIYNCACNLWLDKNWNLNQYILLGGNFFAKRSAIAHMRFEEAAAYGRDEELFYKEWKKFYPTITPFLHSQFSVCHDSYLTWSAMSLNSKRQQAAQPTTMATVESFLKNPPRKPWLYLPALIYILAGKYHAKSAK